ncbi:hypothetical protein LguiA_013647 [Lonicera macranthoides]
MADQYPCVHCCESFKLYNGLLNHNERSHRKFKFLCTKCGNVFASKGELKDHEAEYRLPRKAAYRRYLDAVQDAAVGRGGGVQFAIAELPLLELMDCGMTVDETAFIATFSVPLVCLKFPGKMFSRARGGIVEVDLIPSPAATNCGFLTKFGYDDDLDGGSGGGGGGGCSGVVIAAVVVVVERNEEEEVLLLMRDDDLDGGGSSGSSGEE